MTNETPYPVQPAQIDVSKHFFEAFGHCGTEVSARWIVRFCQERGGWWPFTKEQIEEFYQKGGYWNYTFNHLIDRGWIIRDTGGTYSVTQDFIERCFKSSPAS